LDGVAGLLAAGAVEADAFADSVNGVDLLAADVFGAAGGADAVGEEDDGVAFLFPIT
jgi:hypothetical protein